VPILFYVPDHYRDRAPHQINLKWDPGFIVDKKLTLFAQGNDVQVKCAAFSNKKEYTFLIALGEHLVLDIASQKIGCLSSENGWADWSNIFQKTIEHEKVRHDADAQAREVQPHLYDSVHLPFALFNSLSIPYKHSKHWVVLSQINQAQSIQTMKQVFYSVTALLDPLEDLVEIVLKCEVDSIQVQSETLLFEIFESRKNFDTVDIESISNSAGLDEDSVREADKNLYYDNGEWFIIQRDLKTEMGFYENLERVYGGSGLFFTKPGRAKLTKRDFLLNIEDYFLELERHHIELKINEKSVSQVNYDVNVTIKTEQDWFELHPEIKVNDNALDITILPSLVKEGGLRETKEGFYVLKKLDQEKLRALNGLLVLSQDKRHEPKPFVNIPKLQILDWIYLKSLGVRMELPPDDQAVIDSLLTFKQIQKIKIPKQLKTELRHYQKEGYYWLGFLYQHKLGACLADDMGLGKTVQAIALLAGIFEAIISQPGGKDKTSHFTGAVKRSHIAGEVKPSHIAEAGSHIAGEVNPSHIAEAVKRSHIAGAVKRSHIAGGSKKPNLVVVPASLILNWEQEIHRFYPVFRVYCYFGPDRNTDFTDKDIIIVSYDLMSRDIEILESVLFNVIVFDEAQAAKNMKTSRAKSARRLNADFRLCLTGTPLENHIREYCSIMDTAVPGLFNQKDLKSSFSDSDKALRLTKRAKPFILRRTKRTILSELPPKVEQDVSIMLNEKQKQAYNSIITDIKSRLAQVKEGKLKGKTYMLVVTSLLRLRQICLSPYLVNKRLSKESPKIDFLMEQIIELNDEGHSALIFSQFTSFLDLIEARFKQSGLSYLRLDGSTPIKKRKQQVDAFQNSEEPSYFLISLKAGGLGLNLTKASYVFHMDPWWNPAVETQASDRAHRIGQAKHVNVIRLIMHHSVEEKIQALKQKKSLLYDQIVEQAAVKSGEFVLKKGGH
ncbi:DEAD/DEAH box helicase, partial [Thermoproteota archaeon]